MDLRLIVNTSEYKLSTYPTTNLEVYDNAFTSGASSRMSGTKSWQALVSTIFNAQDVGLLHANGSSHNFDRAVERAGGWNEAIRITKRDIWRNVRVPFLHTLPGFQESSLDWVTVPTDAIPEYSSLLGSPIRGFPSTQSANTTFIIDTVYQTLDVRHLKLVFHLESLI